jgi:choline dehydrogenase-like flavoprotein
MQSEISFAGGPVLTDARKLPFGTLLRTEVCVIGSGAAGITAALELGRARQDVILLEGGGRRLQRRYQDTYKGRVEPSDLYRPELRSLHPPLDTVRQKRIGGTTGAWGGRCYPLDAIDFETRDYVPCSGWPITREMLDPYYVRASRYAETGEYEYLGRLAFPMAPDYLLASTSDTEIDDSKIWRFSRPTDFGKTYRAKLRDETHVRVYSHGNALWLDIDGTDGRVRAVVAASAPGREFRVEAQHFIVAVGGLESARLLLASSQRSGSRMGSGHESLGRYYMTHLDGIVGNVHFRTTVPKAAYSYERSHDGVYCRRLLCLKAETQLRERLLNLGSVFYMPTPTDPAHRDSLLSAFVLAKEVMHYTNGGFRNRRVGMSREEPLHLGQHVKNVMQHPTELASFAVRWPQKRWLTSRAVPSFLAKSKSGEYRLHFSAEQSPSLSNVVALDKDSDEFGIQRLHVRWSPSESDHESIVRSLGLIASELDRLGLASADVPRDTQELTQGMGGGFLGGTHAMGTARMSASPRTGVVDEDCRVHGMSNLFVASSAVFPTAGFGPPTLTIIALAVRVAETVIKELRTARVINELP